MGRTGPGSSPGVPDSAGPADAPRVADAAEAPRVADAAEALRIEGLRKSFGPHEVLRGVDLAVAAHQVICLIGASGSGKSTLLRCVNLLERIDAGTIYLDGQVITGPGVNENLAVHRHRVPVVQPVPAHDWSGT